MKKVSLWEIFITFFKIGAFTFGGGYAMISILEEDLVNNKKWITSADMLDMLVIAESTPGVIAVNTATSVGYKLRGVLGAIVATLGVVLPSFCIIFGLSFAIDAFSDNKWYKRVYGDTSLRNYFDHQRIFEDEQTANKDWFSILLVIASFAVAVFTNFDVIFLILIGGALGVIYTVIKDAVAKKKALPLAESERLDDAESSSPDSVTPEMENTLPETEQSEQTEEQSKEDKQ